MKLFVLQIIFNSHKIYVKKNKSETLFSSNLGLPIILNLIEKKFQSNFFIGILLVTIDQVMEE